MRHRLADEDGNCYRRAWARLPLAGILEMSAAMHALAHATVDHDEVLAAFLERRRPDAQGRLSITRLCPRPRRSRQRVQGADCLATVPRAVRETR